MSLQNLKWIRRSLYDVVSMRKAIGQPSRETHPHIIKAVDEVWPGICVSEFAERRNALMEKLARIDGGSGAIAAILPGYRLRYATRNIFYPFQQSGSMLYMTGFNEPDAALAMVREKDGRMSSLLFMSVPDKISLEWEGPRCDASRAMSIFGMTEVC